MSDRIRIDFDRHDTGCLPGVLQTRLQQVEQIIANGGGFYSAVGHHDFKVLAEQLRGCLAAVVEAREAWLRGEA